MHGMRAVYDGVPPAVQCWGVLQCLDVLCLSIHVRGHAMCCMIQYYTLLWQKGAHGVVCMHCADALLHLNGVLVLVCGCTRQCVLVCSSYCHVTAILHWCAWCVCESAMLVHNVCSVGYSYIVHIGIIKAP